MSFTMPCPQPLDRYLDDIGVAVEVMSHTNSAKLNGRQYLALAPARTVSRLNSLAPINCEALVLARLTFTCLIWSTFPAIIVAGPRFAGAGAALLANLIDLILTRKINPGEVFDLEVP